LKNLAKRRQELNEITASIVLMLRGVELIIYDLDGVIIDSTEAICFAFNKALEGVEEPPQPEEELRGMIGVALAEMFRTVLPPEKYHRIGGCFERYLEAFGEVSPGLTRILDGVEETIQYFKDGGMRQSLATNKSSLEAERILTDLDLRRFFDPVIGSNDVDAPKPSPDMIHLTLNKLKVEPEKAVLVEDSPTGLEAGKASRVHTIAAATGTHPRSLLALWEPDYIVDDIRDLRKILL